MTEATSYRISKAAKRPPGRGAGQSWRRTSCHRARGLATEGQLPPSARAALRPRPGTQGPGSRELRERGPRRGARVPSHATARPPEASSRPGACPARMHNVSMTLKKGPERRDQQQLQDPPKKKLFEKVKKGKKIYTYLPLIVPVIRSKVQQSCKQRGEERFGRRKLILFNSQDECRVISLNLMRCFCCHSPAARLLPET